MTIKGRYHTQPRRTVAQAGPGRSGRAEFQSPAAIALLVDLPRLPSAENLRWRARAKPAISFCQDRVLARLASPASLDKPSRAKTFRRRPGALPAPASIRFPHLG